MKPIRSAVVGALLLLAPAALASQATLVTPSAPLPMTSLGTFLNAALLSLGSCNSGNSAPANGTGAATFFGECWINTTSNPNVVSTYDGTSWVQVGLIDTSAHLFTRNLNFPGYQSGVYITGRMFNAGATGTVALAANTLYAMPLVMDGAASWTKISINVTSTGTAANCRLGVFTADTNGAPSTLLFDGGVANVTGTGTKDVTISQTINPGFYYGVVVCDGTVTVTSGTPGINQDVSYTEAVGATVFGTLDTQISRVFTYGVLSGASPFGALTRAAAAIPITALKK